MLNHESALGRLPTIGTSGSSQWAFSAQATMLPYAESADVQSLVNFKEPIMNGSGGSQTLNPNQQPAARTPIPFLLCPSDGGPSQYVANSGTWAPISYMVNMGSGTTTASQSLVNANDGLFWYQSRTRFKDVQDGASKTLLLAEAIRGSDTPVTGVRPSDSRRYYAQLPGGTGGVQVGDTTCLSPQQWSDNLPVTAAVVGQPACHRSSGRRTAARRGSGAASSTSRSTRRSPPTRIGPIAARTAPAATRQRACTAAALPWRWPTGRCTS